MAAHLALQQPGGGDRPDRPADPDPDLIYPGQILLIPKLPNQPGVAPSAPPLAPPAFPPHPPGPPAGVSPQPLRTPSAPPGQGPLSQQLPAIKSPVSIKFRLDDIILPPIDTPAAVIEFRMTGDVLFMSRKSYPALYVTTRREIEAQFTREANHAFGKLVQDNRFVYDTASKRITVRTMLVSQSNTPYAPATAIGVEMATDSPFPKLRAEIRLPKLEGSIEGWDYIAMDVKFVLLITPKAPPPPPSAQPMRVPVPVPVRVAEPQTNWAKVAGIGLLVVSGAIVIGTIAEDVFTGGAGVADDPASFSAAAAAAARGLAMLRGAALPSAMAPAMVTVGVGLSTEAPR